MQTEPYRLKIEVKVGFDPPKEAAITQPNSTSSTWTDERIERLKALHSNGISFARIAALMGISRNAAIGKAGRLGLSMRGKGYQGAVREHEPRETKPRLRIIKSSLNNLRLVVVNEPVHISHVVCEEVTPRHLTIIELEKNDCRWPYGDGPMTFCGHERFPSHPSYCAFHFKRARQEEARRREGHPAKFAMNMAEARAFGGRP